jgi:hypothetical protein
LVMTPWLTAARLNAATQQLLAASKYTRAFIHAVLGVEEQTLYEWRRGAGWSKSTIERPAPQRAPDLWSLKNDRDLVNDPDGWCQREIEICLAELRSTNGAGR